MSLRLEMLQVARLSPKQLGDAAGLVRAFLLSQQNDDGGFQDRAGQSDLYYTVFGLEGLTALGADLPVEAAARYLRCFGDGPSLDFVHLSCLARCWADLARKDLGRDLEGVPRQAILERIEAHRTPDGGYHATPGAPYGTLYGCFLAVGAYQDLRCPVPEPEQMLAYIRSLETTDGAYANGPDFPVGLTPSTAAAATLLRHFDAAARGETAGWLLARCYSRGGFFASPDAPAPDLLSTATALHALSAMHVPLETIREGCLDFVDSLWTSRGGFYGHWSDDALDTEYTYYALLALGHLSL